MSMTTTPMRSDFGQRLLPTLVDQLSVSDPDRVFLSYQSGPRPKDGYRDFTYKEFAAAVNRYSWWLDENLGRSDSFRTLTYFGSRDLRSTLVMYAAVKTGHKVTSLSAFHSEVLSICAAVLELPWL